MAIRAVLFDVGGPLDTEVKWEQVVDRDIRSSLADKGIVVDDSVYEAAAKWAVEVHAPDAYATIIWRLCGDDPATALRVMHRFRNPEAAAQRAIARGGFELRDGIPDLLNRLHETGLLLGLAANQPASAIAELNRLGIGQYFSHREVTGHHGFKKPDVRLFLRACEDLNVTPAECVMVGDRIDNDVSPANLLGMMTILFRTGRHIGQQPRSADEVPAVEVTSIEELSAALDRLIRP